MLRDVDKLLSTFGPCDHDKSGKMGHFRCGHREMFQKLAAAEARVQGLEAMVENMKTGAIAPR